MACCPSFRMCMASLILITSVMHNMCILQLSLPVYRRCTAAGSVRPVCWWRLALPSVRWFIWTSARTTQHDVHGLLAVGHRRWLVSSLPGWRRSTSQDTNSSVGGKQWMPLVQRPSSLSWQFYCWNYTVSQKKNADFSKAVVSTSMN